MYIFTEAEKKKLPKGGKWGWHFSIGNDLRYFDERKIKEGKTLEMAYDSVKGRDPELCRTGMHASENVKDAHGYLNFPTQLNLVYVYGDLDIGNNKFAGRFRFTAWSINWLEFLKKYGLIAPPSSAFDFRKVASDNINYNGNIKYGKKVLVRNIRTSQISKLLQDEFLLDQMKRINAKNRSK